VAYPLGMDREEYDRFIDESVESASRNRQHDRFYSLIELFPREVYAFGGVEIHWDEFKVETVHGRYALAHDVEAHRTYTYPAGDAYAAEFV
jgi:hypothetical protein